MAGKHPAILPGESPRGFLFSGIYVLVKDSESPRKWADRRPILLPKTSIRMPAWLPSLNQQENPASASALTVFYRSRPCPTPCSRNDAKLSKGLPDRSRRPGRSPTRAGWWSMSSPRTTRKPPHPVLDHDYEIRPCQLDPHEDPAQKQGGSRLGSPDGIAAGVMMRMAVRSGNRPAAGGDPLAGIVPDGKNLASKSALGAFADTSEACSAAMGDTSLAPLQPPESHRFTLRTLPTPQEVSCTKGHFIGSEDKRFRI